MTRTKRIYNKRPLLGGPGLKGWIMSNLDDPDIVDLAESRYVFSRYRYYCMGNCPSCKSHDKRDQKRKTAKNAEVRQITDEFAAFGLFHGDFPNDFADEETYREILRLWDDYEDWLHRADDPDYSDFS